MAKINQEPKKKSGISQKKGYIVDFITGKLLRETKGEPVRQAIEHLLVEDYGYSKEQMDIEFHTSLICCHPKSNKIP